MRTGVLIKSHLDTLVPCVLLLHMCLAAPGQPGSLREEPVDAHSLPVALPNPFGSGEEERRLLQSFIQSSVKESDNQGGAEIRSWEQEVFFLFHLYDFDRSGLLDGLEMMKLLSDFNSHHTPEAQANGLWRTGVVSMVDFLLQTQDLNQDGLLAPSELLSPPLPHTKDSGGDHAPLQHQEVAAEERLSKPGTDEEAAAHEGLQPQANEQPQHEGQTGEEVELIQHPDEQHGQQLPNAPAADQEHYQGAPVHQGQPEM